MTCTERKRLSFGVDTYFADAFEDSARVLGEVLPQFCRRHAAAFIKPDAFAGRSVESGCRLRSRGPSPLLGRKAPRYSPGSVAEAGDRGGTRSGRERDRVLPTDYAWTSSWKGKNLWTGYGPPAD